MLTRFRCLRPAPAADAFLFAVTVCYFFSPPDTTEEKHVHAYAYTTTATRFRWLAALCAGAWGPCMHPFFLTEEKKV